MDNATMDQKIVEAVRGGRTQFYVINAYIDSNYFSNNFRQVDRRLQALRKRGVLTYSRKSGWAITPPDAKEPR